MQNSDSSSLFDDLDAALHSGSSERRVVMLRQAGNLMRQLLLRATEVIRPMQYSPTPQIAY